jgi:hypothetical protein
MAARLREKMYGLRIHDPGGFVHHDEGVPQGSIVFLPLPAISYIYVTIQVKI